MSERLPGAKNVLVYIQPYEDRTDIKIWGTLQGLGINIGQTVDRLITISSVSTLPFAGYYSVQLTARKFLLASDIESNLPEFLDLQNPTLPNPISLIILYITTDKGLLTITLENAYWNASTISVQAGQVLVIEDISFDCEDAVFKSIENIGNDKSSIGINNHPGIETFAEQ